MLVTYLGPSGSSTIDNHVVISLLYLPTLVSGQVPKVRRANAYPVVNALKSAAFAMDDEYVVHCVRMALIAIVPALDLASIACTSNTGRSNVMERVYLQ